MARIVRSRVIVRLVSLSTTQHTPVTNMKERTSENERVLGFLQVGERIKGVGLGGGKKDRMSPRPWLRR